ncbi:hypothetical protein Ppro_3400 [Pelobacter propionicus DSM 2379]|uniref:Glycosyltransferase n=2 Tax=Pelobacter propionicus TaxID=29543 RepID=A1AUH2_PELPD|nr:hypothetical protein Ppro_3400 [Pelobacter propionicus DSM 2379]
MLQMVKYYNRLGVKVHINNPFIKYDVSIVYRLPSKQFYLLIKYLRNRSSMIYFDAVVNYFEKHNHATDKHIYYQRKIADNCDGIICATDNIAASARKFNGNIFVMDDPVDTEYFDIIKHTLNYCNPIFGWSGVSSKALELNKYADIINNRINIISDKRALSIDFCFNFSFYEWRYETFKNNILRCDIALLPRSIIGDHYNNGHSSFKALVFAVSGIPIIANRIPSYEKLKDYFNGVVFIEDYGGDIKLCMEALAGSGPINAHPARAKYSCENQAKALMSFIHGSSGYV